MGEIAIKDRIYSLDIIRGIAAIAVFFTHLGSDIEESSLLQPIINFFSISQRYFLWCNGGLHWGVIVFIVLSGFCIHMPSAKKRITKIIIPYYAKRRFFRIYPVFVISSILGLIVYIIGNDFQPFQLINLLVNWGLLTGIIHLHAPLGNPILITVIVECLLYAIYPLIIPRCKKHWVYLLSSVVFIHFLNFSFLLITEIDPSWLQRNLFSFLLYWWIGAFFAEISFNNNGRAKPPINIKYIVIIYAAYVILSNLINFKGSHVFKSLYFALMSGYFIFLVVCIEKNVKTSLLNKRYITSLVEIGKHSYSLYVIHVPTISLISLFTYGVIPNNTSLFYFLNIVMVTIVTIIFYNFVEKPSHEYARQSSNNTLLNRSSKL